MDGTDKKNRRQKMPGGSKTVQRKTDALAGAQASRDQDQPETEMADEGLSPNLQAHIGRHVRAVFDEVAREPIPEHLMKLLKELERSGDK